MVNSADECRVCTLNLFEPTACDSNRLHVLLAPHVVVLEIVVLAAKGALKPGPVVTEHMVNLVFEGELRFEEMRYGTVRYGIIHCPKCGFCSSERVAFVRRGYAGLPLPAIRGPFSR